MLIVKIERSLAYIQIMMRISNNFAVLGSNGNVSPIASFLLLLSLTVFAPVDAQEIRKWTDENGVVHYSDAPPPIDARDLEVIREDQPALPILKTSAAAIEVFEIDGVVKYELQLGEERNDRLRQYVQRLTATKDHVWITYTGRFLSFDPQTIESTKYSFDHITKSGPTSGRLSGHKSQINERYLVLLTSKKYGRSKEYHIYDLVLNSYYTVPLDGRYLSIVTYDDQFNDGLLAHNYFDDVLYMYNDIPALDAEIDPTAIPVPDSFYSPSATTTANYLWFLGSPKKPCELSFIEKFSGRITSFDHKDMGTRRDNRCHSIVADENEVWVSITDEVNRPGNQFAIYDIEKNSWTTLEKDNDGLEFSILTLEMDADRVYLGIQDCSNVVAIDRRQRVIKTVDIGEYETDEEHRACFRGFNNYTLHGSYLWALKFQTRGRQRYPVFYKIPLSKFDP